MKVGYYCESPADQAAMAVFVEGILGQKPEPINMDLEAHSVPGFFKALDGVLRGVHYNSDADGLVVVVDNDNAELHEPAHDEPNAKADRCRLCEIRKIITRARSQLKTRQGRPELKLAIGVTVPAVEAWYLVGKDHQVGEAAWKVGIESGKPPFTKPQLKQLVYGTDRPAIELETERAVAEARRIISRLGDLEAAFPVGFALMAQEIRSWIPK
jgi:hypothetical protein